MRWLWGQQARCFLLGCFGRLRLPEFLQEHGPQGMQVAAGGLSSNGFLGGGERHGPLFRLSREIRSESPGRTRQGVSRGDPFGFLQGLGHATRMSQKASPVHVRFRIEGLDSKCIFPGKEGLLDMPLLFQIQSTSSMNPG